MNAWSSTVKKAFGTYGSTCICSYLKDFPRQEIDEDDDSTDFKMWQGSLPHKK